MVTHYIKLCRKAKGRVWSLGFFILIHEALADVLKLVTALTPAIWRKDFRKVRAHPSLQWLAVVFFPHSGIAIVLSY